MTITVQNEYTGNMPKNYKAIIEKIVEEACDYVECPFEACVDVLLTDNDEIHSINLEQREIDRPTDVLSLKK